MLTYTANITSDGSNCVSTCSQRLLSPIISQSKRERSLIPYMISESESKLRPIHSIKKELALKIVQGRSEGLKELRFDFGFSNPMGPGYYNFSTSSLSGPSFKFPLTGRSMKSTTGFSSEFSTDKPIRDILKSNRNMEQFQPEIKNKQAKLKAIDINNKIERTKNSKKQIILQKKQKVINDIDSKKQRYEWKIKKPLIIHIAKSWISLYSAIGCIKAIRISMHKQHALHRSAQRYLQILCILSQIIGKIRKRLWAYRTERAKLKLSGLVGVTKTWVRKRRTKYRVICLNLIETVVNKDRLVKLMYQWKRKIIFIQRTMKRLLMENQITWTYRLLIWNKIETKYFLRRKSKAMTKPKAVGRSSIRMSVRERAFSKIIIPQEVKCFFISVFFKEKVKEFIATLNEYRNLCKRIIEEYKKNWYIMQAAATLIGYSVPDIVFPQKPQPKYELNETEMRKLIAKAIEKRDQWDHIIREAELKRRYLKFKI